MLLTDCIACQYGDHANHTPVISPAPPGMMGGSSCPCTGDCAARLVRRQIAVDETRDIIGPKLFDQLIETVRDHPSRDGDHRLT